MGLDQAVTGLLVAGIGFRRGTDADEIARDWDVSGIDKRLETGEFDMGETQFVVCKQL